MSGSRVSRFRSKFFPSSGNRFAVLQEYAMQYYAIFVMTVMIFVVVRIYYQQEVFWIGTVGGLLAVAVANMFAYVKMQRKIAEIFFVNDSFSIISVADIVYEQELKNFPLRFANPTRNGDTIQIHFTDQILTLKREDWDEFDLVWDWLNQNPPAPTGGGGITYTIVP